jgi:hypothetical protein
MARWPKPIAAYAGDRLSGQADNSCWNSGIAQITVARQERGQWVIHLNASLAIADLELRPSFKARKPGAKRYPLLQGLIVAATVIDIQRPCEKSVTHNISRLISAVDSCISRCLARILSPRNEVGREPKEAGMNSIRRIFGLRRLATRLYSPMRHSFAGGGFSR